MAKAVYMEDCIKRLETLLDKTGYMTVEQAKRVNFNNVLANAAIKELVRRGGAFYNEKKTIIKRQPWRKPFFPMIDAIDVMERFLVNIKLENVYVKELHYDENGNKIPQDKSDRLLLGFARKNKLYEIFSIKDIYDLENLYIHLEERYKKFLQIAGRDAANKINYIIIVKNEEIIFRAPKTNIPIVFAFVNEADNNRVLFSVPETSDSMNDFMLDESEAEEIYEDSAEDYFQQEDIQFVVNSEIGR